MSATRLCRALIVDDNVASAMSLMWMAEAEGCEARMCHDGVTALALVAKFRPDILLLDLGMRGMNGFEVCTRVRQSDAGAIIRIIAQTGWGDAKTRQKTTEAGFDAHLVKPICPLAFHTIIDSVQQNLELPLAS